jgi:tetratricopeptide (TPR) repeat protein
MKRNALRILGLCFVIILNLHAQDIVGDAEKAIKDKDYSKALSIAKDLVLANQATDALKILIQLREKNVADIKLYEYTGDAYAKMNVAELAISNYAQAESIDSLDIPLKFKSAELFYKQKRYTDAVNKYLKIISIDPKNAKAFLASASILYQAKRFADAGVLYEKYIALDKTEDAYEKITQAMLEIKNYEKAYNYAIEGLQRYPKNSLLNKNAAISSFAQKKYEEASKYYSLVPDSLLTVNDLKNAGSSYQNIKADSLAIRYYEKVVKKDSTQSGLFMDMANNYFRSKNDSLAEKYYLAKIKADPKFEPAYRFLGFAYFSDQKFDLARGAFIKARDLDDTTFATNYWLAQAYSKLDSTEQASEQYLRILKLAAGKETQYKDQIFEAEGFLGQRAFLKKNYAVAANYFTKIYQMKPNDWHLTEMIGVCYHQIQNNDEAINWYRKTLKLNPNSDVAKKGLRRLSAD